MSKSFIGSRFKSALQYKILVSHVAKEKTLRCRTSWLYFSRCCEVRSILFSSYWTCHVTMIILRAISNRNGDYLIEDWLLGKFYSCHFCKWALCLWVIGLSLKLGIISLTAVFLCVVYCITRNSGVYLIQKHVFPDSFFIILKLKTTCVMMNWQ